MNLVRPTIIFLFFLVSSVCIGQELPPIKNYSPEEYNAEYQNWSISQGEDKSIYVANNSGLLEFNGSQWKLHPSPNETSIRAVMVINKRIYTGFFREFGFWLRNDFGQLEYNSLSKSLKDPMHEDEHIWNIVSFDKWVLFQSLHRIYVYNTTDKTFSIIQSETLIPKVFIVGEGIYFQKMEEGVFKLENGQPKLLSDNDIFKNEILVSIFQNDSSTLFLTQEKGFYYLENNEVSKWNIPANDILSTVSVFSSLKLKNDDFVLGTISNGVYHLNNNGEVIKVINRKNGLFNNTILSMFEDEDQNLWLGLDNGISTINFNSPVSVYKDLEGELGSVYASIIYKENLYLGTNQGLFFRKKGSQKFNLIQGTEGQVWCLKTYDDTLFCGHNLGTFVIQEESASLISEDMGTWDIKPVKGNGDLLIQGHYYGLNILEKKNNKWKYRNKIDGFNISSRYFEFDSNLNLFVSHEWRGVFKVSLNENLTEALNYTLEKSCPKGLKSSLVKYNDNLYYTTNEGVFKYNKTQQLFIKDQVLSINLLAHDNYISGKLIPKNSEELLWGFTDKNILYFKSSLLDTELRAIKYSLPASLRKFVTSYENITHIKNQIYLLGTTDGYILLDFNKVLKKEYEINLHNVEKSAINSPKKPINIKEVNEFSYEENNLDFSYNVSQFDKFQEVNYQSKLEGIYDNWSQWSTTSNRSFENLPFGDYTFKVRAKIGNEISINTVSYSFKINRPFILSNIMLFVYLIIFIGLLYLTHLLNKKYYTRQKNRLIERKQRDFELSQVENERVIVKLRNEKLRAEIDSKSRELASSTLNIVKKNEFLNVIKDKLSHIKNDKNVSTVLKFIKENVSEENNWDLFEESFNNIDNNFLKKLKEAHPKLTANDLRLCTYLRVNLSSKEIAPLLSISPRSVEIKRYRLRKKMMLSHEKNLVEYILEI